MPSRLLIIPHDLASPALQAKAPAYKALLSDLGDKFDLEIYAWPWFSDGTFSSWDDEIESLRARVSADTAVLGDTIGTQIALRAIHRLQGDSPLVLLGVLPTVASLRTLGAHSWADALKTTLDTVLKSDSAYQTGRGFAGEVEPERVRELVELMESGVDWEVARAARPLLDEFDLTTLKGTIQVPTLYLEGAALGSSELRPMIESICPSLEVGRLECGFPNRMFEADSGHEVATAIIQFLEKQKS